MNRRQALMHVAALAATGATPTFAQPIISEQGLRNPCLADLPNRLATHPLVRAAWEGIDVAQMWDAHAHLVGTGDSGSGITVNPEMYRILNARQYVQRMFYMNAGCVNSDPGKIDQSYIDRMLNLQRGMAATAQLAAKPTPSPNAQKPTVPKLMLFAFDKFYDPAGKAVEERTSFHVPNAHAMAIAKKHPAHFEWVASIHPYRADALEALETAVQGGARAVKWLPAAMSMDPSDAKCDKFYEAMARHKLPLITHAGEEKAVHGGNTQAFGNPLKLRRPLDAGVRVIVAHCASSGSDIDLDAGPNGPSLASFALFTRLMDDPKYGANLGADISAVTQLNRAGVVLKTLLERTDWHSRLVNGSDYPLPGVMPLFSVDFLVELQVLPVAHAPVITELRKYNPLLFDFVLKRSLTWQGKRLSKGIFETRNRFSVT
jgi:uncharacterized protein